MAHAHIVRKPRYDSDDDFRTLMVPQRFSAMCWEVMYANQKDLIIRAKKKTNKTRFPVPLGQQSHHAMGINAPEPRSEPQDGSWTVQCHLNFITVMKSEIKRTAGSDDAAKNTLSCSILIWHPPVYVCVCVFRLLPTKEPKITVGSSFSSGRLLQFWF